MLFQSNGQSRSVSSSFVLRECSSRKLCDNKKDYVYHSCFSVPPCSEKNGDQMHIQELDEGKHIGYLCFPIYSPNSNYFHLKQFLQPDIFYLDLFISMNLFFSFFQFSVKLCKLSGFATSHS